MGIDLSLEENESLDVNSIDLLGNPKPPQANKRVLQETNLSVME